MNNEVEKIIPVEPYWNAGRKVFGLWAAIILGGFVATHYNQTDKINYLWLALSLIGLAYMKKEMSFQYFDLKKIFLTWFYVILFGMIISFAAFSSPKLVFLSGYLGVFWLLVMALGHAITGIIDNKSVYVTTAGMQILAAGLTLYFLPLLIIQYLVAGLVGALAMIWLVLYA